MGIRLTTKIDKISMKKYYLNIIKDKDKRIAELEQDLEFTTKTANELIEIKHKLEQELAELKEKAIVPRFRIGQEIWYVYNKYQKYPFRCVIDKIVYDSSKNHKFRYDTSGELYIGVKEEDLFATEQEAQDKLKEIQENE